MRSPETDTSPSAAKARPQRILLIRLRLIGDVVLTTPAIRALRRALPEAHLAYLVEPRAAAVVRGSPHLDDVIVAPASRGLARALSDVALARQLRRERFDVVLDLHGGPRAALLTRASGAPRRIGYDLPARRGIYTERVARPPGRLRHSVENQWDLLEAFLPGIGRPTPAHDPVEMPDDASAGERVAERLNVLGVDADAPLVVVHVGAGNAFRLWPEESFAAVVAALHGRDPRRRIVLVSGRGEGPSASRIRQLAGEAAVPEEAVPVLSDLDLSELRALVTRALVFVGNDSGPAHLAATTRVPIVEVFGPTSPAVWGPWRDPALVTELVEVEGLACRPCDQRNCAPGDFRCLKAIAPERVASAVERALEREAARTSGSAS